MVLEKTSESPFDSKEIKPVNPKGNQPRIFTGRTDAEAEAPILWPPVGELNEYSCLGFRDKAEQAPDLASNVPGHCPDWE